MTNKDVVAEVKEAIRKVNELLDKNESDLQSLKLRLSVSDKLYEMRWEYASTNTPKKDELNNVQGNGRISTNGNPFKLGTQTYAGFEVLKGEDEYRDSKCILGKIKERGLYDYRHVQSDHASNIMQSLVVKTESVPGVFEIIKLNNVLFFRLTEKYRH